MLGSGLYISGFLIIGCVYLVVLLAFCFCERFCILGLSYNDNLLNSRGKEWIRWVYFSLIVLLGWCGLNMAQSYMYPGDKDLMRNSDCHVISHKGFEVVNQQFYLACGSTSAEVRCPQIAIWDDRSGVALLRGDSLILEEYLEPFYFKGKEDDFYRLANSMVDNDVSDGFTIQIDGGEYCSLSIRNDGDRCDYILSLFSGREERCDTSAFHRRISVGYPLIDIIAMMPSVEIDETLERLFADSYIVREDLGDEESRLCLMPGESFFTVSNVTIDGKSYSPKRIFTIHPVDGASFYSGIGRKSTDKLSVWLNPCDSGTKMRLLYAVPHMKPLCRIDGSVFVVSALENVDLKMENGGYLFNIFNNEDNFNHVKAQFAYSSGNANDSLNFEVIDFYSDLNCRYTVCANQEFLLNTKNKNDNVAWIFEMTDLREANDLKYDNLFWFVILFVTLIGLRLLFDGLVVRSKNLSIFEMSAYVVLLSLGCVRFLFCWRVSTFIPIENISPNVYTVMKDGKFVYTYLLLLVPVVMMFMSCVKDWNVRICRCMTKLCDLVISLSPKLRNDYRPFVIVLLFVLSLLLSQCFEPIAPRLFNIVVPIVLYFVSCLLLTRMSFESDCGKSVCKLAAFAIWAVVSVYLLMADGGFLAVFMIYSWLYYCVIDVLYLCRGRNNSRKWVSYVLCIVSVVIMLFALKYQGWLLKFAFDRPSLTLSMALILLIVAYFLRKLLSIRFSDDRGFPVSVRLKKTVLVLFGVVIILGFADEFFFHIASDYFHFMPHTKYRAEVQSLDKNHKIDDLILKEEFDSRSIEYIMRSAHNQWFLNQYIAAGDSIERMTKFRLQPHSNQGVSYPTQTTDVVVTRYVLAEHGETAVILLLAMFTLLICVYMFEVQMTGDRIDGCINRTAIGGPLLVYAISLAVFLSATNRIVFVGQDFPFISVQSVVAILYPMLIILIPMLRTQIVRMQRQSVREEHEGLSKGLLLCGLLLMLTTLSICAIERKGKNQNAAQFNVSNLVSHVSDRIKVIDDCFVDYQSDHEELKDKSVEEVWSEFSKKVLPVLRPDSLSQSDRFYLSLLDYFENRQASKTDINEFLHLRRRNGICHLAVNKRHFFIPPIMREDLQWKGSLCAAETKDVYAMSDASGKDVVLDFENDFKLNLLPIAVQNKVPGVNLYEFGKGWIPEDRPLLLLGSKQGESFRQYYCVISDTMEYISSGKSDQIAFALFSSDNFMIYKKEAGTKPFVVYSRNIKEKDDNYLAKNICLNGRNKLFYPLGKESMWSYQIASLMSEVYGKTPQFRNSTIRLSIDYDLHKQFYDLISDEVRLDTKPVISTRARETISHFRLLTYDRQCNRKNHVLYYDVDSNKVFVSASVSVDGLKIAVDYINQQLYIHRGTGDNQNGRTSIPISDNEKRLSFSLNKMLEQEYDFSAVVIDGDGKIRLLFDYSRKRVIDPNNIQHMNKLVSELYSDGLSSDERDIFGNKTLLHIVPGPASSFKPVAYTAITSQDNIGWESIDVLHNGRIQAMLPHNAGESDSDNDSYSYYGGVNIPKDCRNVGCLSIDGGRGLSHDKYLVQSDNLYHSVMILLGMQRRDSLTKTMKEIEPGERPELQFPTFTYMGRPMCFDKEKWFGNGNMKMTDHSIFDEGLFDNFGFQQYAVKLTGEPHANLYGDCDEMVSLFNHKGGNKGWSFPEISTVNTQERKIDLKKGYNQLLLGANPIEVTPLQMAMCAYRIVTLNSADNIFSLLDKPGKSDYRFFKTGSNWEQNEFVRFISRQVWGQLVQVPISGTARLLNGLSARLRGEGYYLYCKTGTLNDEGVDGAKDSRIKHLMVVISNRQLENINSLAELKSVRFYVMYLSYYGILLDEFSTADFQKYIDATVESEVFKTYMKK